MKLVINGYTVTITAKQERLRESTKRDTKQDTLLFLCNLSSALFDASYHSARMGQEYTAEGQKQAAMDIYNALDKANYFDDIRETA